MKAESGGEGGEEIVQLSLVEFPLLGKSIFLYLFSYIYRECFLSASQLYLKHPFVYFWASDNKLPFLCLHLWN